MTYNEHILPMREATAYIFGQIIVVVRDNLEGGTYRTPSRHRFRVTDVRLKLEGGHATAGRSNSSNVRVERLTPKVVLSNPAHGTLARYKSRKCRCPECRKANTDYSRNWYNS